MALSRTGNLVWMDFKTKNNENPNPISSMNLIEMIKLTGEVPSKATTEVGSKLELFHRKRTDGTYIVTLWEMDGIVQTSMFEYGEGTTIEKAKDDLKTKLLQ